MEQAYHVPVLLKESIEGMAVKPDGNYIDVTFGGGGHSSRILGQLGKNGHLYAFDQDEDAVANVPDDSRLVFIRHNFRYMRNFLRYFGNPAVDGILADLGVSSHDFDVAERGFSFRFPGKLDMRMNRNAGKTAADIVNDYDEVDLIRIFRQYGELTNASRLGRKLVAARSVAPIRTIDQFKEALKSSVSAKNESRLWARIFQALRIETNGELDVLKDFLEQSLALLKPGGRLVVITYHSLEDRLVKNFIRAGNFDGVAEKDFYGNVQTPWVAINRKVLIPSDDEIRVNPRARSAKLRIAEKR